ncbi:DMT family transporter [Fulvivirgaceae bacterium BMA10]|uniref:DMT family transporter n=1 Tax=Splendidivirga corallicola TaxID=3051826 RepID=A0ABT8KP14_9BACT|nr:DMT family transporter [Fulvivirgaceae bacterium BMA10]
MKAKNLLLLLLLASLWGPSFLLIKVAVIEIPPFTLAALRIAIAAVLINIYLLIKGEKFIRSFKFWKDVTIVGFFANALPFVLINWGEQYIDSALASILNALTPLSTILLAGAMIKDERINFEKMFGVFLGLLGLIILTSPNLSLEMVTTTQGIVAVSVAAVSYGMGVVYARLHLKGTKPLHAPASQLLVTALYMIPFSIFMDGPYQLSGLSGGAIASLLILAIFGTVIAYMLYYRILESASASYLSLVTYILPIFGVFLGVVFLNESMYPEAIVGAIVILLGVMIVNGTVKIKWIKTANTNQMKKC